ncbi:MAG: hypothetical protein ACI837_001734 [Crocinitomicaceae bacterium]|jgi:hypothetical protein
MKQSIIIFLIGLSSYATGQNNFSLNSEVGDSLLVEVNGHKFFLNKEPIGIITNYPLFDTLTLLGDGPNINDRIICNFKRDSSYTIAGACCSSLDVLSASKLKNDSLGIWDFEEDHSKIQHLLMDRPFISMRIASEVQDTIYGWYVDMACFPQFKKMEVEKWEYGVPEKCFYWTNISPFIFFENKVNYLDQVNENGISEDIYPEYEEIEILAKVNLRLFDTDRFILT